MDPNNEIVRDCAPLFRQYKSGRVERLLPTDFTPAGLDPATNVTSKDITITTDDITARLYLPTTNSNTKLPILVYYHGGGFCIGSAFSSLYHRFLNSIASKANVLVVSVNYRLAPEHPLPAAYDDSRRALAWALDDDDDDPWLAEHGDAKRVFLAGDSAGANICHHVAMTCGDHHLEGVVLLHPYFWGSEALDGETKDPERRAWMEGLWRGVASEGMAGADDPAVNPVAPGAPSLAGLGCGKVMVCVAEKDLLVERGRAYVEAVKGSGWGGEVVLLDSPGEDHVFHLFKPDCDGAKELVEKMVRFFRDGK